MFTHTTDQILKTFTVTINRLRSRAETCNADATRKEQLIHDLNVQCTTLQNEAKKANTIATKLEKLLSE